MSRHALKSVSVGVFVLAFCSGCTVGYLHRISPESHFAYPNSNVKALGPVTVKMQGTSSVFVPPSWMTSDVDVKVYNAALSQVDGADLVIDYIRTTTLKEWPGLPIYWTEERLEGTAAKMEVGKQKLK